MLADGPLDSPRAVALVSEAAQAMAAAHAVGLAHLRLNPACLHWTRGSGVKITGLGIDAALTGPAPRSAEDWAGPELTDTRDLARLLYAALTGYWPGPAQDRPGPAPTGRSRSARPRRTPGRRRLGRPGSPRHRRPTGCRARRARCPRPCRPTSTR